MGIDVYRESEQGEKLEEVGDNQGCLFKLLSEYYDKKNSVFLRFIDPYQNTTFNTWQIPELVKEFELAVKKNNDKEIELQVQKIIAMAQRCKTHEYLKFYGD